ncbi:MAG: TatD family hydrolase [Clostridia bacterium]|nr:TatD family hydrolase [Clostridia bacterium]
MNIFDTHAHYDDRAFDEDRDQLISAIHSKGVSGIINCGCSIKSCQSSLELSKKYPFVYFACGIHPEDCESFGDISLLKQSLIPFINDKKCVAVGEIGLDYHYDIDKPTQKLFFEEQIKLAMEYDLPVIIHDREAHADTLEIVRKYKPKGVMHCFSGSVETAKEVLRLGMYIGLGGVVTFKNARKSLEVAASIPLDRLLLETDCPYMAPVPFRGKRCDSSMIAFVAEKIAEERGCTADEILKATEINAHTLFSL